MKKNKLVVFFTLIAVFFLTSCGGYTSLNSPSVSTSTVAPNFFVTVADKTTAHPYFGMGSMGFVINGVQGPAITLTRGTTYVFSVNAPGHLFFITTSAVGGSTAGMVNTGVTANNISSGILTFTPDATHPSLLYYQCSIHSYMGWEINIVD